MKWSLPWKLFLFAFFLLALDQTVKVLVKTQMTIGESIPVFGNWFQIHFVENPGFAFGMSFGGKVGKVLLTVFRIVLVVLVGRYLGRIYRRQAPTGVLVGLVLILVGALGNIVDCLFYGVLFGESTWNAVAAFLPEGGGYAPLFMGKVVDMLYFPLIETTWPDWVPGLGGRELIFFRPIFNIADSCITVGAFYLLLFHRHFFLQEEERRKS